MRPCAFLLMLFSFYTNLFSQVNTTGFSIIIPRQKISGSLYSSIQFIDSRKDTGTMGFVQQGFFNKKAAIIAKSPFQDQLENLLDSITGKSGGEGELLFQLRYLRFAEVTNALTEKGYCYIKAALYGKKDHQYVKLSLLDSIVYVKSAEVRKALLRNTSIVLTNFISDNLMNQGNDSDSISYKDIGGIEQFEKKKIPLYIAKTYKDAVMTDN